MFQNCATCGKLFKTWPCRQKDGGGRFCSPKCAYASVERIEVPCPGCGKITVMPKCSRSSVRIYCTPECRKNHQVVSRPCVMCGKIFSTWRSRLWVKNCSRICAGRAIQKLPIVLYKGIKYYQNAQGYYHSRPKGKYGTPIHRQVYEDHYNIKLEKYDTIHHINGDRGDNRPENLERWTNRHPHGIRYKDLLAQNAKK